MKLSTPTNPGVGVYINVPSGLMVIVPFVGVVTGIVLIIKLSPSGSKSLFNKLPVAEPPANIFITSLFAIGELLLTGSTSSIVCI